MDHAARVVERLVIDRQARMLGLAEHAHQLVDGDGIVDRDDVGARHHHVLDGQFAEAEDAPQHAALLRAQRVALAAGERVLDQLAQIGFLAEAEGLQQAIEPRRFLVGGALLLDGKSSSAVGVLLIVTLPRGEPLPRRKDRRSRAR